MAQTQAAAGATDTFGRFLPNWPLTIWMLAITLVIGFAGGLGAPAFVHAFNVGFGFALGEFALILLPSFALAAAMDRANVRRASGVAVAASPLAGAGMICPDTAYAALAPVAGAKRLDVAFGAYSGFKLLYPAGPLIVATGLGVPQDALLFYGLALLIPVWAAGCFWARAFGPGPQAQDSQTDSASLWATLSAFAPFLALGVLLVAGTLVDASAYALLDFITQPKGALLLAAAMAMAAVAPEERRDCLDAAVRRTGALLLVIGIASAFGAILTQTVALDALVPSGAGVLGVLGLFALSAAFKLAQGSSMATFAAVAPVAAPIVAGMDTAPAAAVFAICLGSFVAILPNDSFYWLVRRDVLQSDGDGRAISILAGGAVFQAFVGLALLLTAATLGLL